MGVAKVATSAVEPKRAARLPGTAQVLIWEAQDRRKARAARAGFTKFLPMPP